MRKLVLFAAFQIALIAGTAFPALAHGGGGPDATNNSSVVNAFAPAEGSSGTVPAGVTNISLMIPAGLVAWRVHEPMVVQSSSNTTSSPVGSAARK